MTSISLLKSNFENRLHKIKEKLLNFKNGISNKLNLANVFQYSHDNGNNILHDLNMTDFSCSKFLFLADIIYIIIYKNKLKV